MEETQPAKSKWDSPNFRIDPKLAGGVGIGGYVGTLVVWALDPMVAKIGLDMAERQEQAIIGICAFIIGWVISR